MSELARAFTPSTSGYHREGKVSPPRGVYTGNNWANGGVATLF